MNIILGMVTSSILMLHFDKPTMNVWKRKTSFLKNMGTAGGKLFYVHPDEVNDEIIRH
jgi:hypothetical protein